MPGPRRAFASALAALLLVPAAASWPQIVAAQASGSRGVAYELTLPKGEHATVFSGGMAKIYSKDRRSVEYRPIPLVPRIGSAATNVGLPDKEKVLAILAKDPPRPYRQGSLVVVYRSGIGASQDVLTVDTKTIAALRRSAAHGYVAAVAPQYTNDATTNGALARLGVDRSDRLFKQLNRSALSAMRSGVAMPNGRQVLDFSSAYRLHLTNSSVPSAVQALKKLSAIAYVSPDWTIDATNTSSIRLSSAAQREAVQHAQALHRFSISSSPASAHASLPTNYATTSSLQSMLNTPSDDVVAAYDEIQRHFHQLPGQGEIITNVSLGDLDDASAASNPNDPCNFWASNYGPTTEMVGGQRYLNLPSMPLIPTYTADASGNLSGTGEVCGVDPYLGEVDLDFSMMSPLPHELQRGGEQGAGFTDLFGIAPGAQYRLVVPADPATTNTDILAALLGAALQNPRPNVITASLGFGLDGYGFPGRYLEDDPLFEAIVASIVQNYHIVVTIAANDGTRGFTNAAIGPSGGSAPTNVLAPGGTPTDLNDVGFSTVPSLDFDSGSIDVGGTTLDDIASSPPQYANGFLQAQHAYAETRWNGFTLFSSGFGSRPDLSAPSDNVIAFQHSQGGADDAVDVVLGGGTSASAPEIAAAVAVTQQVARLTGHPFSDPVKLRAFLKQTGSAVPAVSQADADLRVGPQLDLRRAVEQLLGQAGVHDNPSVPRVAVEQRRQLGIWDAFFVSDTDPTNIDLQHSQAFNAGTDWDANAWITIAPDWEFIPGNAEYSLKIAGTSKVLATTPWARLLPGTVLNAAGWPLASNSTRTVKLTYTARGHGRSLSTTFSLIFGPAGATSSLVLAPKVPAVVRGTTIPVTYDFSNAAQVSNPTLLVSRVGRFNPATGVFYNPSYTIPLHAPKGTIQVPVSALQGSGIYSICLAINAAWDRAPFVALSSFASDFAFTRVAPQNGTDARATAPLLSSNGSTPGHNLEIPYGGSFQLSYDVGNVPGATGAELEVSAAGPAWGANLNPFNNPNGSIRDNNGVDAGSVYFAPLSGSSGTVTLKGTAIGLDAAMEHVVRVIPMKGGVAAGEGSDVSFITMDGVRPADGGYAFFGYGVNANGLDGFLTSAQNTASGQFLSSLETFDQTSNAIVQTLGSSTGYELYSTVPFGELGTSGIYANDVGLFALNDLLTGASVYNLLTPVAAGNVGPAWTPPNAFNIWRSAANQANDGAAFLAQDTTAPANDQWRVFTSHLSQNSFSPGYDISKPVQNFGSPTFHGFAEDTTSNTAIAVGADASAECQTPPMIVTVDLANGTVGSFSGAGLGAGGIAVDSVTGKAMVQTYCDAGFDIYNLASKSGFHVTMPNVPDHVPFENGLFPTADQRHGLFLVAQIGPGFALTAQHAVDNNALASVLVYDENGNLVKTINKFYLFNAFLGVDGMSLQLDPAHRSAYMINSSTGELQPFNY